MENETMSIMEPYLPYIPEKYFLWNGDKSLSKICSRFNNLMK